MLGILLLHTACYIRFRRLSEIQCSLQATDHMTTPQKDPPKCQPGPICPIRAAVCEIYVKVLPRHIDINPIY
jgi:hypothetical protein